MIDYELMRLEAIIKDAIDKVSVQPRRTVKYSGQFHSITIITELLSSEVMNAIYSFLDLREFSFIIIPHPEECIKMIIKRKIQL